MQNLSTAELDHAVKRATVIGCGFAGEREVLRQEIWLALLEGRLDVSELYDKKIIWALWWETRVPMILDNKNARSLYDPIAVGRGLYWYDVVANPAPESE